jgi:hypothetical protein
MSLAKVVALWLVIAGLLFVNGVLSQTLYMPVLGDEAGEMMAAFIAIAMVFGVSRPFLRPGPENPRPRVLRISALWLVLTVAFEVTLGRTIHLLGPDLPKYGMWDGSFWPIILLAVASAPITWLSPPAFTIEVTK